VRTIAAIYLAIALVNFGFWLTDGAEKDVFPTVYAYLTWGLYLLSLLALLAFILHKLLLPQRVWQVVFMVYVSTRIYELATRGLAMTQDSLGTDLNILSSYLWLVLPAGLAMWYLGFAFPVRSHAVSDQGRYDLSAAPGGNAGEEKG